MTDASRTGQRPDFHIVALGASAGGLESLERVFAQLPAQPGLAFVVVQHLSPDFRSLMDEILGRQTAMPVRLVTDGERVEPDHVYLLPPRKELTIEDGRLRLIDKSPESALAFPIDRFFSSLAVDAGRRAVAVVLSGTGSDGSRGIRDVKREGGIVLVEKPDTAKFDGMPVAAAATGAVDRVLAASEIGHFLRMLGADDQGRFGGENGRPAGMLQSILWLLHERTGIDFSLYKMTTVSRRVERRAGLRGQSTLEAYLELLRRDPDELDALYSDLLIGVTEFFRDPEVFTELGERVFPQLIEKLPPDEELRVWVAGCATGEEAYSMAILVVEAFESLQRPVNAKVLATDLHQGSLATAGAGVYASDRLEKLDPARRERFFEKVPGGYRVRQELRKLVIFAAHDLTKDAPFTRLHLVSCRNLLIYLDPPAQRSVLSLLHFGLLRDGVLVLGSSESPEALTGEFASVNDRLRLFRKQRDVRLTESVEMLRIQAAGPRTTARSTLAQRGAPDNALLNIYDRLLDRFMPAGLLIESNFTLIDSFAGAQRYLNVPSRRPTQNVLEMLPRELASAVSAAVHHAVANPDEQRVTRVRIESDDVAEVVRLGVAVIKTGQDAERHLLITLESEGTAAANAANPDGASAPGARRALSEQHIETLEGELAYTQEMLQATVEELQTSNEQLQSTNEELVASNEELQSTNEELHSINEELYTVNAEHQRKLAELRESNSDMQHLLDGTDVGILFLDDRLRIRRFTGRIAGVFRITTSDIGRSLGDFAPNLRRPHLIDDIERVLREGGKVEEKVVSGSGETYYLRVLPYRPPRLQPAAGAAEAADDEGPIEGAVVTVTEISALERAEADVARLIAIVESSTDSIIGKDEDGTITSWNKGAEGLYGYTAEEAIGRSIKMLFPPGREEEFDLFMSKLRRGDRIERVETMRMTKDGRRVEVEVTISPILDREGRMVGASSIARDVTLLRRAQREAERRQQRIALLLDSTAEAIYGIDNNGLCTFANRSCARILGYGSPEELIGQHMHDLIHHTRRDGRAYPLEECRIYNAFRRGEDTHVEDEVMWRADGTSFDAEYWSHPIRDGDRIDGAVVTFLDVSARKTAEREMQAEAERREQFLAMLSHELRNPMAAVLNAVQLLEATPSGASDSVREAREIVTRQCRHMARLLDDLLDVSRIAQGKIELRVKALDLRDAVTDAVESVLPQLEKAGVELIQRLPSRSVPIAGDGARLQQVVANLLSNAGRYSPSGSTVTLDLTLEDGEAVVRVQDEGDGIDASLLPKVFDLFVQGQRDIHRTQGGLGVGLSLAKDLVERHRGSIAAHSDGPGKGSTFTVRLPLARDHGARPARNDGDGAANATDRPLHIVLVEDQADARFALRRLLELKGHRVEEAADGEAGAQTIETERPDIAFVDIGLPQIDGYEVARRVRKRPTLQDVMLVALSGYGTAEDVERAKKAGFDRHLTKPAAPERLDEILHDLAGSRLDG